MILRHILFFVTGTILVGLCACSSNLKSLSPSMPYNNLNKKLSREGEFVYAIDRKVSIVATILHKSLKNYRSDISESGTGIEFSLSGNEELFNLSRVLFTITTGDGKNFLISGVGTENYIIGGDPSIDKIHFSPLGNNGGPNKNSLNKFIIIFPFEMSSELRYLKMELDDSTNRDLSTKFLWDFR